MQNECSELSVIIGSKLVEEKGEAKLSQELLVSDIENCLCELSAAGTVHLTCRFEDSPGSRSIYAGNTFNSRNAHDRKVLLDYLTIVDHASRETELEWDTERLIGHSIVYRITDQGRDAARRVLEEGGPNWEDETTIGFVSSGQSYQNGISESVVSLEWGVAA
jgi:hypothetical protein